MGLKRLPVENVQLRLASSLGSLAPRMQLLENRLAAHVRITLYQDTVKLVEEIEAITAMKVSPWDADRNRGVIPPAHLLMRFLPSKEEGGVDESKRLQEFKRRLFPTAEIHSRLQEMRIVVPEIPQAARDQLLNLSRELFSKFLLEPRDMLLHGRPDDAIKRLNRILTALEEFDQRKPKGEKFQEEIARWREKVNDAFAQALKKKGAEMSVWTSDKYLNALLDLDRESVPRMAAEKAESLTLTFILLRACRAPWVRKPTTFWVSACKTTPNASKLSSRVPGRPKHPRGAQERS